MKSLRLISMIQFRRPGKSRRAEDFEDLAYAAKTWADQGYEQRYHVFKTPTERVTIAAKSAKEAMEAAGCLRPYKVVRGQPLEVETGLLVRKGRLVTKE